MVDMVIGVATVLKMEQPGTSSTCDGRSSFQIRRCRDKLPNPPRFKTIPHPNPKQKLCLPLPVFVVEPTEVFELCDFFEVLGQFIQLPVFLPVQVGLHEWSDLIAHRKQSCITLEMTGRRR